MDGIPYKFRTDNRTVNFRDEKFFEFDHNESTKNGWKTTWNEKFSWIFYKFFLVSNTLKINEERVNIKIVSYSTV